jgi:hypothetical protein
VRDIGRLNTPVRPDGPEREATWIAAKPGCKVGAPAKFAGMASC